MSIHAVTVTCFAQMLHTLETLLAKGEEHARKLGFDPQNLLDARLAPDMYDLAAQVRFTCTQAREAVERLSGQSVSTLPTPANMAEAKALIRQTVAFLADADGRLIDDSGARAVAIELPNAIAFDMTGEEYARNWATPQFYFHLVTAYNILRHNGVPLGKAEYAQHMLAYLRQAPVAG
ncbi:DUF1993 domain-containing protein [Pseudomonas sessilinigenes]|uniref:DUF1993 domain-containing protein n=1 Tax=Pseudomonas sessilinigenes TaxID=658629 RepID=A0ABX8MZJ7_9PSED|nr:DUF1993 domain-containing protein [Pseudomonas sessilinigenes]AZC23975.1 hypothetical protein C4K39_2301 [Pseudomonas sessilinigenes]QXH42946.1 DUF1993 domain-containing protein [Pseudomonas sessilinigenes]